MAKQIFAQQSTTQYRECKDLTAQLKEEKQQSLSFIKQLLVKHNPGIF